MYARHTTQIMCCSRLAPRIVCNCTSTILGTTSCLDIQEDTYLNDSKKSVKWKHWQLLNDVDISDTESIMPISEQCPLSTVKLRANCWLYHCTRRMSDDALLGVKCVATLFIILQLKLKNNNNEKKLLFSMMTTFVGINLWETPPAMLQLKMSCLCWHLVLLCLVSFDISALCCVCDLCYHSDTWCCIRCDSSYNWCCYELWCLGSLLCPWSLMPQHTTSFRRHCASACASCWCAWPALMP